MSSAGVARSACNVTWSDAVADFIGAMKLEGIRAVEPIAQRLATGELIRFRCEGDGRGRQNGWAILYLDERPAGAFGNYRLGISRKWRVDRDLSLSPDERRRLQQEWIAAKQRRQEERDRCEAEAALEAVELWSRAGAADPAHPYLVRKSMEADPFRQAGDRLLVPMYDGEGALRNVQRIDPEGNKRFLRGGRTAGLFFLIGNVERRGQTVCIGEGVATMAAIRRAAGHPVIAAFSAKNLLPVARLWWAARPDLDFIVCGDDDRHLENNVGRQAAEAAAAEIGAKLVFPNGEIA